MRKQDLWIAPLGEAFLIFIAAIAGWLAHQPLIFASLGPTAYELVEQPNRRSARPWNVFGGHATAVGAGYLALLVTGAWWVPAVSAHGVPFLRIWAAVLAAALTAFFTLLLHATQPAALSTTLLVSLGVMQTPLDAGIIMAAVTIMLIVGEPLRRVRLAAQNRAEKREPRPQSED